VAARAGAGSVRAVDVETAIRTRRTHKAFAAEPVPRDVVEELLELARWAPNHHLTQPWRFRVLGPESFERLVAAGGPNEREKLGRAPTLVVASARLTGDEHQNHEDVLATACATYVVLLAAHARGLASYWRTPKLLETDAGRAAVGLGEDERFVALIHLGRRVTDPPAKERRPPQEYVEFLA
jgi:nitroreductase